MFRTMKCEWLIVLVINSVRAYLPGKIPNRGSDLSETISIDENEHMQLIQSIIDDGYNKKIKPHSDSQLNVSVNIFVDTMSDISESSMDYEMTIFFRQFWNGKDNAGVHFGNIVWIELVTVNTNRKSKLSF